MFAIDKLKNQQSMRNLSVNVFSDSLTILLSLVSMPNVKMIYPIMSFMGC